MSPADETHLKHAIVLSRRAGERGDEPYGAVLAHPEEGMLAEGENTQNSLRDCTGHAELNLLREASRRLPARTLERCTVYASGEPCPMCAGAIFWSGVQRVVFALDVATMQRLAGEASDELLISCGEVLARGTRRLRVEGPHLAAEAAAVLQAYYGRSADG